MCRHLAYVGPPIPLSLPLLDAPHSLLHQSWAPADMRGSGTINADGYGAGWYPGPGAAGSDGPLGDAVRFRSASPLWSDPSFAAVARATVTPALLAAVRSATVGMPVLSTAPAPFAEGRWLFSHNGRVTGWPGTLAPIAARLPVTDLLTLDAPTDAATLWALVRAGLRAGEDPAGLLGKLVAEVGAAAPDSRLNLLLTDGATIWATTWGHALSVRRDERSVLVASEPLETDPAWREVPDRHLLVATPGGLDLHPL